MAQSDNIRNEKEMRKSKEADDGTFTPRSYAQMKESLEDSEKHADKERDEFLEAWLAAPVRYNIK